MLRKSCGLMLVLLCALPVAAQRRDHDRNRDRERIGNDASRLAAVLNDVQYERVRFDENVWRRSANEALVLANRLYADSGGRADARDARLHVRQMRAAANRGDFAAARDHARQALPFVYTLTDWARERHQ